MIWLWIIAGSCFAISVFCAYRQGLSDGRMIRHATDAVAYNDGWKAGQRYEKAGYVEGYNHGFKDCEELIYKK